MFYFCRLKAEFADEFLTYLLSRLFDNNLSVMTRRTCAGEYSSFLFPFVPMVSDLHSIRWQFP